MIGLVVSTAIFAAAQDETDKSQGMPMMNQGGNMMMSPEMMEKMMANDQSANMQMMNMQMMHQMMHRLDEMEQDNNYDHGAAANPGMPKMGAGMGKMMMNPQMMQTRMQHMVKMEQHLEKIESLLAQILEAQKSK